MSNYRRRPGVEHPADWARLGELGYQPERSGRGSAVCAAAPAIPLPGVAKEDRPVPVLDYLIGAATPSHHRQPALLLPPSNAFPWSGNWSAG